MKDIMKKYKKKKKLSSMAIIITSLVIALSINFFILKPGNINQSLKSNLLEANNQEKKADLYLESSSSEIILKTNKNLNNITNLTISFAYNPENVKLLDIISNQKGEINNISNIAGITMLIIDFPNIINLKKNDQIIKINTSKKENISEQLNIIKSNFTDINGEIYAPTTSGITF